MKKVIVLVGCLLATPVSASDLTLNDLPMVLKQLRGCTEVHGVFGKSLTCDISAKDLWVSVGSDGELTLFKSRSYGDITYAHGNNVNELLRDFADNLNRDQRSNKKMLDAMALYLPTQ